jgi:hypothetical protein
MRAIDLCFIPVHVPDRDNADQTATNGEGCKEKSPHGRLPQRVISFFVLPVPRIPPHYERFAKEDLLRLFGRYTMLLPVLRSIRFIPVKSDAGIQLIPSGLVYY